MNKKSVVFLLLILGAPALAPALFPMYEIGHVTNPDGRIYGINNSGDYVTSRSGGYTLVKGGISYDFSNPTGNSAFPTGFMRGLGDNGVCFGTSQLNGVQRRAAVWSVENGWQVMPSGPFRSDAVGITTGNRVLCSGSEDTSQPLLAGWWQVGQTPTSISGSLSAIACDNQGNAVFYEGFGSTLVRADGTRIVLKYNNMECGVTGISRTGGRIVGFLFTSMNSQARMVMWDLNGNVIDSRSYAPQGASSASTPGEVNAAGEHVGTLWYGQTQVGYLNSASEGLVTLNSLLTPAYAGWNIQGGVRINNGRQIVAYGTAPGSTQVRQMLLNPVPEPASMLTLGGAIGGLLIRRKSRQRRNP